MWAVVSVTLFSIFLFVVSMLTAGVSATRIGITGRFRDFKTSQIETMLEICLNSILRVDIVAGPKRR